MDGPSVFHTSDGGRVITQAFFTRLRYAAKLSGVVASIRTTGPVTVTPPVPGVEAVGLEPFERPIVRPADGWRSGEPRTDHVAQVLEILHHLGAVERLVDQSAGPRRVDGEILSGHGSDGEHGECGGRRQDVKTPDGSSVTMPGGESRTANRRRAARESGA